MEREQSFCGDDVMCRANGKVDGEEMANVKSSKMKGKKKKKKNKAELTPGIYTNSFFTIKVSKVAGRVAVAARSIERGTSILVEEPFCLASSHMTLCPGCGRFGDHNNVTASDDTDSVISYCSLKCMESNGADCVEPIMHCLREAAAAFHCDLLLLVITYKILCRIRRDESDKEMMPLFIERNGHVISTIAGFLAQVDHVQEQSEEWKFAVRSALAFVLDTQNLYPGSSLDDSTLAFAVAVASRVNMNSYGIVRHLIEEPTPAIGVGVFPIAAVSFNHSCSPNIVNVFVNGKMEYRALCDISSGDELCVSYIDCTSGTVARRNILSESRFFHCACRRCSRFDMIMSSSGAQCSDNLEELDTITQDTSAICDVMLAGLHCPACGPAGVVIISSLNGSVGSGHSKLCWCLLCKQKFADELISEGERTLKVAEESWTAINETIHSLPPQQQILHIEKWLLEFDPGFSEVVSGMSQLQQHRAKRTHDLQFQLHTCHYLLVDVYVAYFNAMVSAGHENVRLLQHLRRGLDILCHTIHPFAPERVAYECRYVDAISSFVKKNIPKKMGQSLRQEMQTYVKHINDARSGLCYIVQFRVLNERLLW